MDEEATFPPPLPLVDQDEPMGDPDHPPPPIWDTGNGGFHPEDGCKALAHMEWWRRPPPDLREAGGPTLGDVPGRLRVAVGEAREAVATLVDHHHARGDR